MYKDIKKVEFILMHIDDIFEFVKEFKTIENTLNSKLGWNAVNMSIMQIGETLKNKLSEDFIKKYGDVLPIKESYYTRNYIAHDYENVDMLVIETIIREHLPKLKKDLIIILEKEKNEK